MSQLRHLPMVQHYYDVKEDVASRNKELKCTNMMSSNSTYHSRYRELIDLQYNHIVYESYLPEALRMVISRWRLSNHSLRVETDRYLKPKPHRSMRTCKCCGVVEDESHIIFVCPELASIRDRFAGHLRKYSSIREVLNPTSVQDAMTLGNFLLEIEKRLMQ